MRTLPDLMGVYAGRLSVDTTLGAANLVQQYGMPVTAITAAYTTTVVVTP